MTDLSVPMRNSLWSGTGTVTVPVPSSFCMTMWLPRLLTSTKPFEARIRQTSRPERTRSLPNRDLYMGHVDLVAPAPLDFLGGRRLEEERDRFLEVAPSLGYGVSLAGNIHFRTQCHVPIAFPFDDRCQLPSHLDSPFRLSRLEPVL